MLEIRFSKDSSKFIKNLPAKMQRQIAIKIQEIRINAGSHDSKKLIGSPYFRSDVGEYRIIYEINNGVLLLIVLVGKRNDGDVYKKLSRKSHT